MVLLHVPMFHPAVAMVIVPLGNALEALLKKDVVKSGDGLTLGLSTNMMKFFSMEGPFVGMWLSW